MQTIFTTTTPQIQELQQQEPHQKDLAKYLQRIQWETETFSNQQLEAKIGAAMLRYLGGITELSFVLELAKAIRKKEKKEMSYQLLTVLDTCHDLSEKIHQKEILITDTATLRKIINEAQKVITKKGYDISM